MKITTQDEFNDQSITATLGLVKGNAVRARHLGKDIMAGFRGVVGGEISEYTKLMGESREQAVDRMVAEAEALGGNAIIMTRFSTSQVMSGAAELLAYAEELGIEYELEKITDITRFADFGVMMTPGLVVDGELKVQGKVATVDEIDTSRDSRHLLPLEVRAIQTTSACLVYLQKRKVGALCLGAETCCCRRTG